MSDTKAITPSQADTICDYIEAFEKALEGAKGDYSLVIRELEAGGYTTSEVDAALRSLGLMAGRECGI